MNLDQALTLERKVWEALVDGDGAADESLLAADFLGVYESGFSDRAGHVEQLAGGPTVHDYHLSSARLIRLAEDQVIVSYRADWRRPDPERSGRPGPPEAMYISSIWARRSDRWVNTFSQDTPTEPNPGLFATEG